MPEHGGEGEADHEGDAHHQLGHASPTSGRRLNPQGRRARCRAVPLHSSLFERCSHVSSSLLRLDRLDLAHLHRL